MTFTSPTDDIILQEGTFAFDYDASGTVNAGQAVYCTDTLKVSAIPANAASIGLEGVVGVAAYTQTDGNPVAVYGPGNIVRVIISGTAKCIRGEHLTAVSEGKFANVAKAYASGVSAIALETKGTAGDTARVLLI